jgi:hypothetical protein
MKRLYITLTCCLALLLTTTAFAQEFEVPENVKLDTKDDHTKYEQDIIKAAKWLESTPINKKDDKRIQVNAFVMMWLTGSPTVTVNVRPLVMKLSDKNPNLMLIFMAGYARWVLENNYDKDEHKGYLAGVKSMINTYNLGGDVKKNKDLQKAIDADKAGTLDAWLKENFDKK